MTLWTLVIHQDKISKDVRGTQAAASSQSKAAGTHKGREADDGKASEGDDTDESAEDPANKGCNTTGSDVKGRKAVTDR